MNREMLGVVLVSFLAGCSAGEPGGESAAGGPAATVAPALTDEQIADAKAAQELAGVQHLLGGDGSGARYALAEAVPLRTIGLSALTRATGPADPALTESVDRIYPVLQDGNVVASLTLHKVQGQWLVSAVGRGHASQALIDARQALRQSHAADGDRYSMLHVLDSGERFMLHQEKAVTYVTALRGATLGAVRPAAQVLSELAARARVGAPSTR